MWRTQNGERVLVGAEGALFRAALTSTVDHVLIEFDESDAFGFPNFDRLEGNARLALLAEVGAGLLRADVPKRNLNSLNETAIAVIYDEIETCVSLEIDSDMSEAGAGPIFRTEWRQLILDACHEQEVCLEDLPEIHCDDYAEWSLLIESLRDMVLWDEDWMDDDAYLDVDPAIARTQKQMLGIADDYFCSIPPDPAEAELANILTALRELTGNPVIHPNDEVEFLTGIEDLYHGVFAGPCGETTAALEAEHPLILHVGVPNADQFDVTYEQWLLRVKPSLVSVVAMLPEDYPLPPVPEDEVRLAQGAGLPGGDRFEKREEGWVIIDADGLCLADTPDPTWCPCEDGEGDEPAYFEIPEAAWLALKRSEIIQQMIHDRRDAVLRRLGLGE